MSAPDFTTYGPLGDAICLVSLVLTGVLFVVWVVVMMIGASDMANRQRDQYREVTDQLHAHRQRNEDRRG